MTALNQKPNQHIDRSNLSRVQSRRQKNKKNKIIAGLLILAIILVAAVPTVQYYLANNPTDKVSKSTTKSEKSSTKSKKTSKSTKKSSSTSVSKKENTEDQQGQNQNNNQQNESNQTNQTAGEYTVQAGDSLYAIATNNGLTLEQLLQLNDIEATAQLQPGMKLKIK